MSKPDTKEKKKAWRPQIGPFIQADNTDSKPYRMLNAVSFARTLAGEHTMQAAANLAATYLEVEPGKVAFELGRALAFGWNDSALAEQFKNGLRDGFKGGAK